MDSMRSNVLPEWVNKYMGIPWRMCGHGFDGADCWGLVRLVLEAEFGVTLPTHRGLYDQYDEDSVDTLVRQEIQEWNKISCRHKLDGGHCNFCGIDSRTPREGDAVLFNMAGTLSHVGIMLNRVQFLHSPVGHLYPMRNRLSERFWERRIEGLYTP